MTQQCWCVTHRFLPTHGLYPELVVIFWQGLYCKHRPWARREENNVSCKHPETFKVSSQFKSHSETFHCRVVVFFFPTSVTRTQTAQLQINAPQLSPGGFRLCYPPEICGLKWLNLGFFFSINITENGPGRGGVHGEKQGFYYWRTQWAETNRHTNTYEGNPFYSGLQNPVAGNHVLIIFCFVFLIFIWEMDRKISYTN